MPSYPGIWSEIGYSCNIRIATYLNPQQPRQHEVITQERGKRTPLMNSLPTLLYESQTVKLIERAHSEHLQDWDVITKWWLLLEVLALRPPKKVWVGNLKLNSYSEPTTNAAHYEMCIISTTCSYIAMMWVVEMRWTPISTESYLMHHLSLLCPTLSGWWWMGIMKGGYPSNMPYGMGFCLIMENF